MNYRKLIIKTFTFLGGIYFFLIFILPNKVAGVKLDTYHEVITNAVIAVGAMAVGLGVINLFLFHGSKIAYKKKHWIHSLVLLLSFCCMMYVCCADAVKTNRISSSAEKFLHIRDFSLIIKKDFFEQSPDRLPFYVRNEKLKEALVKLVDESLQRLDNETIGFSDLNQEERYSNIKNEFIQKTQLIKTEAQRLEINDNPNPIFTANDNIEADLLAVKDLYQDLMLIQYSQSTLKNTHKFLMEGLFIPLAASMFSLLGFYVAVAAFRAFRIKSPESAVMLGAALIVMLGQIPFGVWLWQGFPELRLWILAVPSTAVARAIVIGASVASLVMAVRMWFSVDSIE